MPRNHHRQRLLTRYAILMILLLSAALRFHALGQDVRFHPDEALYTTFARSAVVYGEWMLPGVLDKPPLSMYASAVSIHFLARHPIVDEVYDVELRQGEFAARVPNVFASILLTAVVYALAKLLCQSNGKLLGIKTQLVKEKKAPFPFVGGAALLAAFLTACSPFVIVFSATAFTDMLMVLWAMLAFWLAVRGRSAWSGVCLALSIATKPQGIFYLPLVLGGLLIKKYRHVGMHGGASRPTQYTYLRFVLTFFTGMALLLYWDAARPETSLFILGNDHYSIEHWIMPLSSWWPRLTLWLKYAGWLLGPPVMTWGLVVVGLIGGIVERVGKGGLRTAPTLEALLWLYIISYFVLHWLGGFSTFDRYLLPIAPLLAMGVARGGMSAVVYVPGRALAIASFGALIVLFSAAWNAASWQYDLGRDHYPLDREGEIIQLAQYLDEQPVATIIYDPWLGWEMGYYLGVWSDKRHVHYPDPQSLVADAVRVPETGPRYLIAPTYANVAPWLAAVEAAGFETREDFRTMLFVSFRLLPPMSLSAALENAAF